MMGRRAHKDEGYASLTVAALLGVLSLTGAGYMRLAMAEARLTDRAVETIETDLALDGAFAKIANGLASGEISVNALDQGRLIKFADSSFHYRISDEAGKISLLADPETLKARLADLDLSSSEETALQRISRSGSASAQFTDWLGTLDPAQTYCFREQITPFRPAAAARRPNGRDSDPISDGAILRMEIFSTPDQPAASLDAAILITGQQAEPVWVLDWIRGSDRSRHIGDCS